MKKAISMFLVLAACLSLCGCSPPRIPRDAGEIMIGVAERELHQPVEIVSMTIIENKPYDIEFVMRLPEEDFEFPARMYAYESSYSWARNNVLYDAWQRMINQWGEVEALAESLNLEINDLPYNRDRSLQVYIKSKEQLEDAAIFINQTNSLFDFGWIGGTADVTIYLGTEEDKKFIHTFYYEHNTTSNSATPRSYEIKDLIQELEKSWGREIEKD